MCKFLDSSKQTFLRSEDSQVFCFGVESSLSHLAPFRAAEKLLFTKQSKFNHLNEIVLTITQVSDYKLMENHKVK